MSDPMAGTMAWLREREASRLKVAKAMSVEHFAESAEIPDLEFRLPVCPICLEETEFDNESFTCNVCDVWWGRDGFDGERLSEEER